MLSDCVANSYGSLSREMSDALDRLKQTINQRIAEMGISQGEFARRMGHEPPWASALLNGKRGTPIPTLGRIAKLLGLDISELFGPVPAGHGGGKTSHLQPEQAGAHGGSLEARVRELEIERDYYRATLEDIAEDVAAILSDSKDRIARIQKPRSRRVPGKDRGSGSGGNR